MNKNINYFEIFKEALDEKEVTIKELEENGVITKFTFYKFSRYCPSLKNAISIANYLQFSLDYILDFTDSNKFENYLLIQNNFYNNLCKILKMSEISKAQFCKDTGISDSTFTKWKKGETPKLSTLIEITKYLRCNIDDLLDHE